MQKKKKKPTKKKKKKKDGTKNSIRGKEELRKHQRKKKMETKIIKSPKRKFDDNIDKFKRIRSNNLVMDDRILSPLANEIRFLDLQDKKKDTNNSRKRKIEDPVDKLLESKLFTRMKLHENDNKIITTPLKLFQESEKVNDIIDNKKQEENNGEIIGNEPIDNPNYSVINGILRQLALERLSRNSKN